MKYKETMLTEDGTMFKKSIVEVPEEPSRDKKIQQRLKIQNEVFDIHDSVADNAKMISLLITMLNRIYTAIPEDIKTNISPADRSLIEYALNKKTAVTTRADIQVFTEGAAETIDKLFARQAQIGNIVK